MDSRLTRDDFSTSNQFFYSPVAELQYDDAKIGRNSLKNRKNECVAARKDSDMNHVKLAYDALVERLIEFETNPRVRKEVIGASSIKSSQDVNRLERYFGEVINRIEEEDFVGLESFLSAACNMENRITMAW